MDLNKLTFETVTLEDVEKIENDKAIKKDMLVSFAQRIGITRSSYKSRKEVIDSIRKFVTNRDILSNIKDTIVGKSE